MAETGRQIQTILRDAIIVFGISAVLALAVNAARPDGLSVIAKEDYQILVPCPETAGEVEGVAASDPRLPDPQYLLVDARAVADRKDWSPESSLSIPYDYLEPTPPESIDSLLHMRAKAIFVCGDGGDPDSGEQLARELAGKGIRNVFFVKGGAPALKAAREGGAP
ncbi:MAG: rhodanese-like domain-containing protein [Myxococcales bacterium]|nr:MAG: rhodanese-like domain-containing protein [Myxococcales bacterium]